MATSPILSQVQEIVGDRDRAKQAIALVARFMQQDLDRLRGIADKWSAPAQRDLGDAIRVVAERWRVLIEKSIGKVAAE